MALKFGTSGVRGLVSEMTDLECFLYTKAFVDYVQQKASFSKVAISGDLRSSSPRIKRAIAYALSTEGYEICDCGKTPTQALVYYCMQNRIPGLMVTGSHIPDDRNGIKFNLPWGEVLKDDEAGITEFYEKLNDEKQESPSSANQVFDEHGYLFPRSTVPCADKEAEVQKAFIDRYLNFFPKNCLGGLKVVHYQHSAVGRDLLSKMLSDLGASVVNVGRSEVFVPVDTEAVESPEVLGEWVKEHDAHALVSCDGDSDRPLIVDESGSIFRGDILGILVADYLGVTSVSAPISCNTALEICGRFDVVKRTKIGSPYVIASMIESIKAGYTDVVGYEANGGFLTATDFENKNSGERLTALPTRDAILPILVVLTVAAKRKKSLSELAKELPQRFTASGLIRNFPSDEGKAIVKQILDGGVDFSNRTFSKAFGATKEINGIDGARITFTNGDIVHFRPSGNAPEFRCYTESNSYKKAESNNQNALTILKNYQSEVNSSPSSSDEVGQPEELLQKMNNIRLMNSTPVTGTGMDVIIISTTSPFQEDYWQVRLETTRGEITNKDVKIIVVHEDWENGAGNGLGTLYAVHKARKKCRERYHQDLLDLLRNGAAVGLYHTAGKGTRLAPLPGSETNNKPGVKLPGLVHTKEGVRPITILEAVIKQTSIYAGSRKRRVSVFWGDQVFIPSVSPNYGPEHHADILCQLGKMPGKKQWERQGLEKYGLIAVNAEGNAFQVEKIDFKTAEELINEGVIQVEKGIGISLGSFSLSYELLGALLDEFAQEITEKKSKYDSDPHFWMPLTLDQETYIKMMDQKKEDRDRVRKHYRRMATFKRTFQKMNSCSSILGAVNIGQSSYWWDYGTLQSFMINTLKLLGSDDEANAIKEFFRIPTNLGASTVGPDLRLDHCSCLLGSHVTCGKIKNSVLIGTQVDHIEVEDSVIIAVSVPKLSGNSCLVYNVLEDKELCLGPNSIMADSHISKKKRFRMQTSLKRKGDRDWKNVLPGNTISYEELHRINKNVNPLEIDEIRAEISKNFVDLPFK